MAAMIRVGDLRIGDEERNAILQVIDSGRITEGPVVRRFEREFAANAGAKHCVAVSSGTSALIAGLLSLIYSGRIKKGSKVITTPLTYISTVNAIVLAGLEPVFADTGKGSFNITPETIEARIRETGPENHSLILPVHLMGYGCDMEGIRAAADKYNLLVFEDAAQAHGTKISGKNAGQFSIMADFSFYIAHNIQAGEMGAVVTDDSGLASLVRQIKANGRVCDCNECVRNTGNCPEEPRDGRDMDPRFTHEVIGYNFKTMEFQAALGLVQLAKMEDNLKKRRANVRLLNEKLHKFSGILELPPYDENVSYLAYPIVIKNPSVISRLELRKRLKENMVESRPLFGCIPLHQPAYSSYKRSYEGKLDNAEYAGVNGFYIGCHQYIGTEEIDMIERAFTKSLKGL